MAYKYLLAKKSDNPKSPTHLETLLGHTEQVIDAMDVLSEALAPHILKLFDGIIDEKALRAALFCSAWLHDIGKANDHFQKMLRDKSFVQGIRHESLGLVIICEILDSWLEKLWIVHPFWWKCAVLFAVSGHHLKFPDTREPKHSKVTFAGGHSQVRRLLNIGAEKFDLGDPPDMEYKAYSLLFDGIANNFRKIERTLKINFTSDQKLFIAVVKATLMGADIAGSALPDKTSDLKSWLRERIFPTLEEAQLKAVIEKKLGGKTLRKFQREVGQAKNLTVLVEAACGSGKTAAAYLWASRQACGKRLFLCYPTTATASEGFSGYLPDPDFSAILVHSRARIDYRLLENIPAKSKEQAEVEQMKMEALDTWSIPVAVCTTHTVLGLLQNVRRGICAWPSLCRSVFVFDEIHSYSPTLFRHLLRFLTVFHSIPVLLMTATLPIEMREALDKACYSRGAICKIQGPVERERAIRYMIEHIDEETAWKSACRALENDEKVLWICNTVTRAMAIAKKALDKNYPVQPYHSRYRYKDRLERQRALINGFDEPGALLAVSTQVAEMSLDLSADLLISEWAPIEYLIQRMGRLNRKDDRPLQAKSALFYQPENALPYFAKKDDREFWQPVEIWLAQIGGSPKSQYQITEAFFQVQQKTAKSRETDIFCDWIDDPWTSLRNRHSLVDASCTLDIVRQEDMKEGVSPGEVAIPMIFPLNNVWKNWQRRGRYLIAPQGFIEYDKFEGAKYAKWKNQHQTI